MQQFQFYPDIRVKHLGGGTIFLGFSFYPDIRAKYLGGGNIFLGNVYNPMFFILSCYSYKPFGGKGFAIYFWDVYKTHCKDRMVNVN